MVDEMDNEKEIDVQGLSSLPFWDRLTPGEKTIVTDKSVVKTFSKNQIIGTTDTSCIGIIYVQKGGIRVSLLSDEGREITLYRLNEGECCITTASCVIKQITFDTMVTASDDAKLLVIPAPVCSLLADTNIYFRAFMFETETERFSQAIWVIQQLLFKRFDQRLAGYLISASEKEGSTTLKLTQEEIARDVNSAREVVTRTLKHFSDDELVEVKRGYVIIKDVQGLKDIQ